MAQLLITRLVFVTILFLNAISAIADYTPRALACYQSTNLSASESIPLCELSAYQGDAHSQFKLAELYLQRNTHGTDLKKSITWLQKAAVQAHAEAQYNLAIAYQYGKGTNANPERALHWYKKSAQLGFARAQRNLAHMYESGTGTQQDLYKAFLWFEKSALQGLSAGQLKTGLMLLSGIGTKKNEVDALTWISRAAQAGNPDAQFALATILKSKSPHEAIRLYRKAADKNHTLAMYNLAIHYTSPGTEQDVESALLFADKAVRAGHLESVRLYSAIKEATRANLEQHPASISDAVTPPSLPEQDPAPGRYALQLVFSTTLVGAQHFIDKHNLTNEAQVYRSNIKGEEKFIVLAGSYESNAAAKEALKRLAPALRATKPFSKSVESLAVEGYRAADLAD